MSIVKYCTSKLEEVYDIKQELGRGQFAVVKKCHSRENAEHTAAAKFIKVKRSRGSRKGLSRELIEREAGILSVIKHEKIIQLYNVFDLGQEIVLVLELLSGGELFDKICECEFLTEIDACSYMRQVLEAIKYIHNLNIVHLDIKPENIVLQSKERPEIKLVDFGLSQRITPGEEVKEMMGTPEFVAPEIVNYEPIHTYTDMWAIGVLAFILLSGCSPFLGDDNQETYASICAVEYDFDEEYFAKISQHAKDFISSLLQKQPNKRLTAIECSEHPWLVTMSAPRPRTESIFIATARLKKYLARRRWQQSFQKLAAINRFSKFLKKGNATEMNKISEAQSIKNETNNLTAAEATLSASTPHRKKSLAERKYSREVQVHYTELLRESKVIEEDNRTSIVIEEEEDNRVSVIIEHEENSRLTLPIEQEEDNLASVSIEEEGENRTTVITEEDWSNNEKEGENNDLAMTNRQEEVATDEEVYRNTGRRNSARKKAVFNDHKHLLKDNLKSRDRALSLTIENNKMFDSTTRSISLPTNEYLACKKVSMNACEKEIKEETDIEGSRLSVDGESSSSGDPEVSMVKKTRKRVIPAKTIGMEHLIDIILIDDKDTKKIDDIIPLSVQLANWNKAYKETAV